MPAICGVCQREMVEGGGCVASTITIAGQLYKRLRYESEAEHACFTEAGENGAPMPLTDSVSCHDCGAGVGALHHLGCDVERCPRCHRQLISCDCEVEH